MFPVLEEGNWSYRFPWISIPPPIYRRANSSTHGHLGNVTKHFWLRLHVWRGLIQYIAVEYVCWREMWFCVVQSQRWQLSWSTWFLHPSDPFATFTARLLIIHAAISYFPPFRYDTSVFQTEWLCPVMWSANVHLWCLLPGYAISIFSVMKTFNSCYMCCTACHFSGAVIHQQP